MNHKIFHTVVIFTSCYEICKSWHVSHHVIMYINMYAARVMESVKPFTID